MERRVAVVGGGASGLTAAIAAARGGASVTVLEHMDRVGRKILSTGNGRCNLTNLALHEGCYRGGGREFPMRVLSRFTPEDTLAFFEGLGILPMDRDGYVYPHSGQASSVLNALLMELSRLGVEVACGFHASAIRRDGGGWIVESGKGRVFCDRVILACGSKAAPSTGSDGSGYGLASGLGHRLIRPLPALVQLKCAGKEYKQLAGVRTQARVAVLADGRELAHDTGELQLTDYGVSGIPVFQVSRHAAVALDRGRRVRVRLDFMPSMDEGGWRAYLERRASNLSHVDGERFLNGVLNQKLAAWLLKFSGFSLSEPVGGQGKGCLERLIRAVKCYESDVTATNPFAQAQVCSGGVDTAEVDPETLESRVAPGVHLTGELLDVDGICGGYNLQWAWATGYLAGGAAASGGRGKAKGGAR